MATGKNEGRRSHACSQDNVSSGSGTDGLPVNFSAMRVRKTTLVLLVLLAAFAVWIPQRHRLAQARLALVEAEMHRVKLDDRIAAATAALEFTRRQLHEEHARRAETLAAVAKVERELARVDPESQWVAPPASSPDWNAESPYVWLRKDMLPKLGVKVFTDNGGLRPEIASVLTASHEQQRALNTALPRLLAEYRALEVANAERTDEHLTGIEGEGPKVTIRIKPMPEEGAQLKQQFEAALRDELGAQRSELLMQLSESWLNQQLNHFGAEPTTISAMRDPNGRYSISIKSGGSWWTHRGVPRIDDHIPPHLLPLFSDILSPTDSADPTGAPETR